MTIPDRDSLPPGRTSGLDHLLLLAQVPPNIKKHAVNRRSDNGRRDRHGGWWRRSPFAINVCERVEKVLFFGVKGLLLEEDHKQDPHLNRDILNPI